ncbi:MAG: hypothetical protein JSU68_05360 [Phycisphaerales bacterium]|nr:MAG: hypothetical protein JSU68_05360 [Phycisphaerales bacterium]
MSQGEPPPEAPLVSDSGMRCLVCDYNVTGLRENRCPECGTEFDPDLLRRVAAGQPIPCTPWDTRVGFVGFWQTWAMSLFTPWRLADNFAPRHNVRRAVAFTAICYSLAGGTFAYCVLWIGLRTGTVDDALGLVSAVLVGAVFACWLCETLTSAALALLVKPTCAKSRYHFWRGIAHYTSGFTLLTAAWGACGFYWNTWSSGAFISLWFPAAVIFLWWVLALLKTILRRNDSGLRAVLACLVVPVLGFGAILVGYWSAIIVFMLFAGLWNW